MITQNKQVIRTCNLISTPNPIRTRALGAVDKDIDSVATALSVAEEIGDGGKDRPHDVPLDAFHRQTCDGHAGCGLASGGRIRLIDYDAEALVSPRSVAAGRKEEGRRKGANSDILQYDVGKGAVLHGAGCAFVGFDADA